MKHQNHLRACENDIFVYEVRTSGPTVGVRKKAVRQRNELAAQHAGIGGKIISAQQALRMAAAQ